MLWFEDNFYVTERKLVSKSVVELPASFLFPLLVPTHILSSLALTHSMFLRRSVPALFDGSKARVGVRIARRDLQDDQVDAPRKPHPGPREFSPSARDIAKCFCQTKQSWGSSANE